MLNEIKEQLEMLELEDNEEAIRHACIIAKINLLIHMASRTN